MPTPHDQTPTTLPPGVSMLRVRAVATPEGCVPGPVLVEAAHPGDALRCETLRVLAIGPDATSHPAAAGARVLDRPHAVLTPGFVNAHTHLDLTAIGPRRHDPKQGFVEWVRTIVRERPVTPEAIRASVERGVSLALEAGVVAVGDIAGVAGGEWSLEPSRVLRESPLAGVSFVELFGIGNAEPAAIDRFHAFADQHADAFADRSHPVRLGLQPHTPYSVSLAFYRAVAGWAGARGVPCSTHLAETAEEAEFVANTTGPFREFLASIGLVDETTDLAPLGQNEHPVAHLSPVLGPAQGSGSGSGPAGVPWLLAHLNDAPDDAIERLHRIGATVAYCPRASAYFGADKRFGPHRYAAMLAAGVPVALGTDSIVNLPWNASDPAVGSFGPLNDARLLFRRDGARPADLLSMLTTTGARALGLDQSAFELRPGANLAGLVAIDTAPPGVVPTGVMPTAPTEPTETGEPSSPEPPNGATTGSASESDHASALRDALAGNAKPVLLAACRSSARA